MINGYYIQLRFCLVQCKIFSQCKIISAENVFGKGKYFLVFGCIPKMFLKNIFMCLFLFLKMLLRMHFLPISNIFFSFQTNIIIKIPIYKPKETKKTKRKSQFHKPNTRLREREREREREYRVEVVKARLIKRSSDSELEREKQQR